MSFVYYGQPGVRFDAGFRYDDSPQPALPSVSALKPMKIKIAQNLRGLNERQKVDKLKTNITKLTGNPDITIAPALLTQANTDYSAADAILLLIQVKNAEMTSLVLQKDELVAKCLTTRLALAGAVEAGITDPAKVPNTGFDLAGLPTPTQPMGKVQNNHLSTGDNEGTGDAGWDAEPNASAYKVQTNDDPNNAATWKNYDTVTASHLHITGQVSGHKLWTRVCAVNSLGSGPWSDAAGAMIP